MARKRKKRVSLYEVMGRTGPKSGHGKLLGQLYPGKSSEDKLFAADSTTQLPEGLAGWPKRPRIVQFNAGRIDISIPYQLAIALLLGIILLILVFFRLGQITYLSKQKIAKEMPKGQQIAAGRSTLAAPQRPYAADKLAPASASVEKTEPARLKGNNRIVIQTYPLRAHLEPAKEYFAQFGIETEIKKIDDWYYLLTKEKYKNPERSGTDGYFAKQRIIELGAKYKAPSGYETFGTKPFHDAYGKRFDD